MGVQVPPDVLRYMKHLKEKIFKFTFSELEIDEEEAANRIYAHCGDCLFSKSNEKYEIEFVVKVKTEKEFNQIIKEKINSFRKALNLKKFNVSWDGPF